MAIVRLFASAREAAGLTSDQIDGPTVEAVLDEACRRYGERFSAVLGASRVWVNGEPAGPDTAVVATDVVAVLPPVSGGSNALRALPEGPAGWSPGGTPQGRPRQAADSPRPGSSQPGSSQPGSSQAGPTAPRPPQPNSGHVRSPDEVTPRRFGPGRQVPIVRGNLALVAEPGPEPEPEPAPDGDADLDPVAAGLDEDPERPPLAVVHHSVRPHGRLGMVWAAATVGCTVAGPGWLAGWFALAALVAATQTAGVWRRRGECPLPLLTATIAAALPLAASFASVDAAAVNGVIVAGVLALFVARLISPTTAPLRDMALSLAIAVPIGLAAASPVLLRHRGMLPALLLLGFAAVYDASAYLIGTGARSAWEGPAAGVAAFVPLTIFAAVIFIPPFSGVEPLVLGLLAAALTPIGPVAGSALLGNATIEAPGLRRLDSLLILGPIWTWVALIFLR